MLRLSMFFKLLTILNLLIIDSQSIAALLKTSSKINMKKCSLCLRPRSLVNHLSTSHSHNPIRQILRITRVTSRMEPTSHAFTTRFIQWEAYQSVNVSKHLAFLLAHRKLAVKINYRVDLIA